MAALTGGQMASSDTVSMDPPPKMRVMELVLEQKPAAAS
jgi:hypothetical protein